MIAATGLVLMMSIPGLALFYAGMVRKKNVLATMAQTLAAVALGSILWVVIGYSLAFTGEGACDRHVRAHPAQRHGHADGESPFAKTIPKSVFMLYQMTFAVITVALVAGSVADRMRFSAFLLFAGGWLLLVYVPIAHWVWGGGFLGQRSRPARFRRRHGGASQRRRRRPGRLPCARRAARLWHRKSRAP